MGAAKITPAKSEITTLGHVRIVRTNLIYATERAQLMGLVIDQIYGNENKRLIDVSCRRAGPRGNHEPRWTNEEREQFAALGC